MNFIYDSKQKASINMFTKMFLFGIFMFFVREFYVCVMYEVYVVCVNYLIKKSTDISLT